jgi:hypothetical protein
MVKPELGCKRKWLPTSQSLSGGQKNLFLHADVAEKPGPKLIICSLINMVRMSHSQLKERFKPPMVFHQKVCDRPCFFVLSLSHPLPPILSPLISPLTQVTSPRADNVTKLPPSISPLDDVVYPLFRRPRPSGRRPNLDSQTHHSAEPRQHVDERVHTKQVDPTTEEIADAGLSHAEYLRGWLLLEATGCDKLLQVDHEVRSDQQMLSLLAAKPEVTEYISAGWGDLEFHVLLPSRCTYHSALGNKALIALSGEVHIMLRRFPSPPFKGMEHVDRVHKLGDVADAMLDRGMNSDLTDAGTDRWHRFPVSRLQTMLHLSELKACKPPEILRECLLVIP